MSERSSRITLAEVLHWHDYGITTICHDGEIVEIGVEAKKEKTDCGQTAGMDQINDPTYFQTQYIKPGEQSHGKK